jgi:hydroxybutyrate-dimer hydrolase
VVRTIPRGLTGAVVNPISASNVPPIKLTADAADQITFASNVVTVAD